MSSRLKPIFLKKIESPLFQVQSSTNYAIDSIKLSAHQLFQISWCLTAGGGNRVVWAARAAAGAGGAGALSIAPLYCAEIAPRSRALAAMPALACRYVYMILDFVQGFTPLIMELRNYLQDRMMDPVMQKHSY